MRSQPSNRQRTRHRLPSALQWAFILLLTGLAACGGGIIPGTGGPPSTGTPATGTVSGEVERVESYANEIDIWTDDRRIFTVNYDANTTVYYRGQRYSPDALEAGDLITVSYETSGSTRVARRIDVDRGQQDRPGGDDPYDDDAETATLEGEIEDIDTGTRQIEIDTGRDRATFRYETDTVVYYQGDRYQVANLEVGDVVRTRVERDYRGFWVTDSITVERSRQERGIGDDPYDDDDDRYGDDVVRYAGTVQEVDERRGEFVLRTERYGVRTIVMPYNASRADRLEFDDLRRGDRVEIEVEPMADGRAELLRFGWR